MLVELKGSSQQLSGCPAAGAPVSLQRVGARKGCFFAFTDAPLSPTCSSLRFNKGPANTAPAAEVLVPTCFITEPVPGRGSLCSLWGSLQLVQKPDDCSMTDEQDIALLGELVPGQNHQGCVPLSQLRQLRSQQVSSSYPMCLFTLNHHFAVEKSSNITYSCLTCGGV